MILTSVLILVTFPWVDSLFCFRKARDERLRPGSRQRKGCDGFREEDLSPVATKGCRGGHRLSLATLPPPDWYRNFPLRFCFNTISLFSRFRFCLLHNILLRFNAMFTLSAKSTFDLETLQLPLGHGFGLQLRSVVPLPVHGITIHAKPVSKLMPAN